MSKFRKFFSHFILIISFLMSIGLYAQTTIVPEGSLIIDMGVSPQTVENGLKPYGLAYELINIRKVPIVWAINPTKNKDGIDFTVDGRDFYGGPFIVLEQYLADANVQASIATWEAKGVVTYITLTDVTVDLYRELNIWPRWVLDTANGSIAEGYLELAEIPSSAYTQALPSGLTACDDLFILPHADPTWEDHGYLYDWNDTFANGGSEGWLWSGCHAVSVFESLVDPSDPSRRMNFLSNDPTPYPDPFHLGFDGYGLIDFGDHADGSGLGYSYSNANDSFMQFMGTLDGATENGSEQVYLPYPTGSWRASTTIAVWDPNQSDVLAGNSPGLAGKVVYGNAFGDSSRGKVMYEGGHDLDAGTEQEKVAAIRAFLNFSFDAPAKKAPTLTDNTAVPLVVEGGDSIIFNVDASSTAGNSYTFTWNSTCSNVTFSGTTSTSNNTTTSFDTNPVLIAEDCIITLRVVDLCGRESFKSYGIKIIPPPTPPVANDDNYYTYDNNEIALDPLDNDTDINFNIDPSTFTPTSPLIVAGGTFVNNGNGDITFIPTEGFTGTATLNYSICDDTPIVDGGPLCNTAVITVNVAASPCVLNAPVSSVTDYATAVFSENNWKDADRALGAPDTDFSRSDNDVGAFLVLDLGDNAYVGSQILFRVFSDDGNPYTGTVDAATTATGFPNNPVAVSVTTQDPLTDIVSFTVLESGTRYVRIEGIKNFGLESVEYQRVICLDPPTPPVANDDIFGTYDISTIAFNAIDNDTDINFNIDPSTFTTTSPLIVAGGTFVNKGNGDVSFIPTEGFTGTATLNYSICDDTPIVDGGPLCNTAVITVNVAASPCVLNAPVSSVTDYATAVFSENNWKDADRALGAPDTDFSRSDNDVGAFLVLDLGDNAYVGSQILFRVFSDDGNPYTGTVDAATTATGFPNNPVAVSVTTQDPLTDIVSFTVLESGTRYVRIEGIKNFGLESVEFQRVICLDPPTPPVANADIYGTYDVTNLSFNPLDNDTDINSNIDPSSFTPTSPLVVAGGTFFHFGNGFIGFDPNEGFVGTATLNYSICDDTPPIDGGPLCDTATITVVIEASPCGLNEPVSSVTDYATAISSENNWSNADRALGAPDADFSRSDNDVGAFLVLDLGDNAYVGSQILFRVFSDDGNPYTGTVDAATTATGFPNNPVAVSVTTQDPLTDIVSFTVLESGTRYVRIEGIKNFGLESVEYQRVICLPPPAPPVANDDDYGVYNTNSILINPLDNDTDINSNIDPTTFTPTSPLVVAGGTFVDNGNGNITFIPTIGFVGTATLNYSICDDTPSFDGGPFCDTATISILVYASGCAPTEYMGSTTAYASSVFSSNNWSDPNRTLGAPDTNFSKSNNDIGAFLILDLGANVFIGSQILFRVFSDDGNTYTGTVDAATTTTGFPNNPVAVSVTTQDPLTDIASFTILEAGIRYVRIEGIKNFGLESVEYEMETCFLLPIIDAVADDFSATPVNNGGGGIAGDITINDTRDAVAITDSEFIITLDDNAGLTGASIDADGNVNVPAGTPGGAFTLIYTICEIAHPGNCDSASILIYVEIDSDNDGIIDLEDLDDDNDGIPDVDELGSIINNNQPACGGDTAMDFSAAATLESGTALQQGAVYRIANVTTGTDALVTIAFIYNATVANIDNNGSEASNFKPQTAFNLPNIGDQAYVEYKIEFVTSGGSTPVVIPEFFMNFNDIDGGANYGEQNWVDNPASYTIDNPTELTITNDGSWVIATAGFVDHPGSSNIDPEVNLSVSYNSKSEMSLRVGAVARVAGASAGGRQHSIEFNCVTNFVSPETYGIDNDSDGIANHIDLDSDNDGIYDAVEAGHNQPHTNGVVNGAYGANGLANVVETVAESGVINYSLANSDGADPPDYLDTDSDADGCEDVLEAGYTDNNGDGLLGPAPVLVNVDGLVTSGTDGYTTPTDADSNSVFDYREAGTAPSISTQPVDTTVCPGCNTTIFVVATNADTYQWQLFNGSIWVDLTDSGIHSGTSTSVLTITNATAPDNGNQYRVIVSNTMFICNTETSNTAILTLQVNTVITNRRITYRVNKN